LPLISKLGHYGYVLLLDLARCNWDAHRHAAQSHRN